MLSEDSLGGLAQLHEIENHGHELIDRVIEHGVREARRQGKSWADIAEATGVARQAAWRRWTDHGIERVTVPRPRFHLYGQTKGDLVLNERYRKFIGLRLGDAMAHGVDVASLLREALEAAGYGKGGPAFGFKPDPATGRIGLWLGTDETLVHMPPGVNFNKTPWPWPEGGNGPEPPSGDFGRSL